MIASAFSADRFERRLRVEMEWLLEDYAAINPVFQKILDDGLVAEEMSRSKGEFFYKVAFVGPVGTDNDAISKDLLDFLLKNVKGKSVFDVLSGVAVNFVSSF